VHEGIRRVFPKMDASRFVIKEKEKKDIEFLPTFLLLTGLILTCVTLLGLNSSIIYLPACIFSLQIPQ
jgi:hypothetical protein